MTVANRASQGQKLAYTPHELRSVLGLGRDKIYTLIQDGRLRSVRVDRRILIPSDAVAEFLKGQK
jgi:excisionase family DNA binding protein